MFRPASKERVPLLAAALIFCSVVLYSFNRTPSATLASAQGGTPTLLGKAAAAGNGADPARLLQALADANSRLKAAEEVVAEYETTEKERTRLAAAEASSPLALPTEEWRSDLKIYIYDLPPDFNTNLLDPDVPRFFPCRSSMYGAEILIHEQLLISPFRTMDPEEANLFFVPIYTSCFRSVRVKAKDRKLKDRDGTMLRGRGTTAEEDMFHFVYSALDYIAQEFPYWNRQHGRDHIFTFTHDFGACFTYHEEETYKLERLQIQQALHNSILLQYLGDLKSTCFHSHKDIVIPPLVTNKPMIQLKGGMESKPIAERKTGVYFRGKVQFNGGATRPGYSRGVRAKLNATFHASTFFSINEGHSPSYLQELTDSIYCLAPPGYALWTPRLTEAIIVGCIPLVIGDDIELPFERLVDYRSLAVRVAEASVADLESIVQGIDSATLEVKRANVQKVWQRYVYNEPSKQGDAFDTIMQLLARKVKGTNRPIGNDAFI